MFIKLQEHAVHYGALVMLIVFTLASFYIAYPETLLQMAVGVIAIGGYVIWGILHHAVLGDLTKEIVLEYFTLAILLLMILWSYLFYI